MRAYATRNSNEILRGGQSLLLEEERFTGRHGEQFCDTNAYARSVCDS